MAERITSRRHTWLSGLWFAGSTTLLFLYFSFSAFSYPISTLPTHQSSCASLERHHVRTRLQLLLRNYYVPYSLKSYPHQRAYLHPNDYKTLRRNENCGGVWPEVDVERLPIYGAATFHFPDEGSKSACRKLIHTMKLTISTASQIQKCYFSYTSFRLDFLLPSSGK